MKDKVLTHIKSVINQANSHFMGSKSHEPFYPDIKLISYTGITEVQWKHIFQGRYSNFNTRTYSEWEGMKENTDSGIFFKATPYVLELSKDIKLALRYLDYLVSFKESEVKLREIEKEYFDAIT